MTRFKFITLCNEYTVDFFIAIENEKLRQALKDKDDLAVEQILKTEF